MRQHLWQLGPVPPSSTDSKAPACPGEQLPRLLVFRHRLTSEADVVRHIAVPLHSRRNRCLEMTGHGCQQVRVPACTGVAIKSEGSIFDPCPAGIKPLMFLLSRALHRILRDQTFRRGFSPPTPFSSRKRDREHYPRRELPPVVAANTARGMIFSGSCVDRSGLTTCQLWPPLVVLKITLQP